MNFRDLLNSKDYILFDGGMGTMLQAKGMKLGAIPETLNVEKPEWIYDVHREYVKAGANVIYANTFGANRYKLKECDKTVDELIKAGIDIAKKAVEGTDTLVALDVGPIGQLLEPTGTLSFEEAYDMYKEIILAGKDANLVVFETQTDLYELKAAVLAAKENSDLPIVTTMTFEKNHRTFTGCGVSNMVLTMDGLGVDAMGVNCSLGPEELMDVVREMRSLTDTPIVVKPNAGLPDPVDNTYDIGPKDFANQMSGFVSMGCKVLGGCCGTNPEYIKEMRLAFEKVEVDKNNFPEKSNKNYGYLCSAINTVCVNQPMIVGERINPTGKKKFKEALLNDDINYILNQGIEQVSAGADILDVNVGLPGVDEKEMMVKAVKALQSIIDVPLQIDSTIPEVLEAALRVYNGKALVNSVNGEEKVMENILPIVAKYGAATIGLTLDENGIPKKAEERYEIAKKIMERAMSYGIKKEDIYIDCLTLTASAEQDGVMETLKAIKMVKENLGLKTILGVSNISFGLPGRGLINHTFLAMALSYGLDLCIINPNVGAMSGTVFAYRVLKGYDRNSVGYIEAYGSFLEKLTAPKVKTVAVPMGAVNGTETSGTTGNTAVNAVDAVTGIGKAVVEGSANTTGTVTTANSTGSVIPGTLEYAIEKGLKSDGETITRELLKVEEPLEVINKHLIPALDKAGDGFEKGTLFLPQLIMAADVANVAFAVIKDFILNSGEEKVSKGKIVLATVKGDVHDIGKNIVKVLLENYGYEVIDLGKDVPYEEVLNAAVKYKVKLVGLSALMTTTLVSMKETIDLLRKEKVDCKIMVGGAVLTPEYAKEIGADFYSKDAKESVDIAKKVLG